MRVAGPVARGIAGVAAWCALFFGIAIAIERGCGAPEIDWTRLLPAPASEVR